MNLYKARAGALVADFLSNMSERMASSESVVKQLCNLCGRSDDDLQEAAIHLLEDILRQDAGARLLVHGKSEINRICQLLISSRDQTQRDAALALGHIVEGGDDMAKKAIQESNGVRYLCMLLSSRSSPVQTAALDTTMYLISGNASNFQQMSVLDAAKNDICEAGGVAPLCEMISNSSSNSSMRVKALLALREISSAGPKAGRSIVSGGGIRAAVRLCTEGSGVSVKNQEAALQLLVNVASQSTSNGRAVHDAGGLGLATSLLHSGADALVDKATELVQTLSSLPEAAKVVEEYGGVEVLVRQLDDQETSVRGVVRLYHLYYSNTNTQTSTGTYSCHGLFEEHARWCYGCQELHVSR